MSTKKVPAVSLSAKESKALANQFRAAVGRKADPQLLPVPDPKGDVRVLYFLVVGLPPPYAGGEYFCRFIGSYRSGKPFPAYPPRFEFVTPNGFYREGGAICTSIGEFHAGDSQSMGGGDARGWRPALGMIGFARQAIAGMVVGGLRGIRIVAESEQSAEEKRRLAGGSRAWNEARCPDLVAAAAEVAAGHPDHPAAVTQRRCRAAARVAAGPAAAGPADLELVFGDAAGAIHLALGGGAGEDPALAEAAAGLVRRALATLDPAAREALQAVAAGLGSGEPPALEAVAPACGVCPDLAEALAAAGPEAVVRHWTDLAEALAADGVDDRRAAAGWAAEALRAGE